MSKPIKLHLGCGTVILKDWVNLDCVKLPGVDIVHDLNVLPLPFEAESVDEILCNDVFEHVAYIPLLKDCHRLLVPGGKIHIEVPHFSACNNYVDPTHINMFSVKTFNFFVSDTYEGKHRGYYFDFSYRSLSHKRLTFNKGLPFFYNYLVDPIINSSEKLQYYYEATFLARIFPAVNIQVTLVK